MELIDTHVHLNFDVLAQDLNALQNRWRSAGVNQLVHSCVKPDEFPQLQSIADRFPEVFLAVGLHPLDAHLWSEQTGSEIYKYVEKSVK